MFPLNTSVNGAKNKCNVFLELFHYIKNFGKDGGVWHRLSLWLSTARLYVRVQQNIPFILLLSTLLAHVFLPLINEPYILLKYKKEYYHHQHCWQYSKFTHLPCIKNKKKALMELFDKNRKSSREADEHISPANEHNARANKDLPGGKSQQRHKISAKGHKKSLRHDQTVIQGASGTLEDGEVDEVGVQLKPPSQEGEEEEEIHPYNPPSPQYHSSSKDADVKQSSDEEQSVDIDDATLRKIAKYINLPEVLQNMEGGKSNLVDPLHFHPRAVSSLVTNITIDEITEQQVNRVTIEKIKAKYDNIQLSCNGKSTLSRYAFFNRGAKQMLNYYFRRVNIVNHECLPDDDWFDKLLEALALDDKHAKSAADVVQAIQRVELKPYFTANWVSKFNKAIVGILVDFSVTFKDLTALQHNNLVETFHLSLKRMGNKTHTPVGKCANALYNRVNEDLTTARSQMESMNGLKRPHFSEIKRFLSFDDYILIISKIWDGVYKSYVEVASFGFFDAVANLGTTTTSITTTNSTSGPPKKKQKTSQSASGSNANPRSSSNNGDKKYDNHACTGCGKHHPGGWEKCNFTHHPDFNKDKTKAFENSEKGKAMATLGKSTLQWTERLSADKTSMEAYKEVIKDDKEKI